MITLTLTINFNVMTIDLNDDNDHFTKYRDDTYDNDIKGGGPGRAQTSPM